MLRKFNATALALCLGTLLQAQDSTKTSFLTVTGSADVYYKYDFGQSKANNYTSFTSSHNTFELGMASVKLDYKTSRVQMVADLGFGKRASDFSYNDEGILASVKQLYLSYAVSNSLKLTAGSWATHIGYELVDANLNRNYSMSYMFTNGPFFHTGVKAEATLGSVGLMLGVANPTDFKYVPDGYINKKFALAQLSYSAGDIFKMYLNYVGGQGLDTSKTRQVDLVLTSKLGTNFSIGYNGTINSIQHWEGTKNASGKSWWGSAIFLNADVASWAGITVRSEYFSDKNHLKIPTASPEGCKIFANTLSANFKADNLVIIPEFRLDRSSEAIFVNKNGASSKTSANVLLAAIYQF